MKNKFFIISTLIVIFIISACNSKYPIDLGKGYKLDYDGNSYFYIIDLKNTVIVHAHVTKYGFNEQYILVEQKPRDGILRNTHDVSFEQEKKIIEKSTFRQYWIINKTNDSIYGPLKKEEYLKKSEELRLPENLVLEKNN